MRRAGASRGPSGAGGSSIERTFGSELVARNIRINVVSPTVFVESMEGYAPFFRGFEAIPVARAALAFSRSVEGGQTGQVYRVY